ncbi:MAG: YesL family protein [Blautia sp.]|nr:YesL family protein [Blautia sp.]
MRNFLSPDNAVMSFITRIVYAVWLNILWFVFSLPVFTAGASTTALFYVTLKMARNEEGNITAQFVQAFRENFRFSTKVWLIMLAGQAVLALDGYVLWHMRFTNAFWTFLTAVYIVLLAGCIISAMYIFPLMARFENTVRAMFINSIMVGIRYLLCTAAMAAIYFIMLLIIVRFFTPAVIFGEGLCAFLCSYLLSGILERLAPPQEPPEENSTDEA